MIRTISYHIKLTLPVIFFLLLTGCSKDNRFAGKFDGKWKIEYIEEYEINNSNTFNIIDTYTDAGTVALNDKNKNKHKDSDSPVTNPCSFEWNSVAPSSILNLYQHNVNLYWSVDVTSKNNIIKLQIMTTPGGGRFYFSTYTVEIINDTEQLWTFYGSEPSLMDNTYSYQEIWRLKKL